MNRRRDRRLAEAEWLIELAKMDPVQSASLAEWLDSGRGWMIFDQIVEAQKESIHLRQEKTRNRRVHRIWAATGVVAVVVATTLILAFILGGASNRESPVTTAASSTGLASVSRQQALTAVIDLVGEYSPVERPQAPTLGDVDVLRQARQLGIISSSDRLDDHALNGPTTNGEYVVWLWRAFGHSLPSSGENEFHNAQLLTGEVSDAVDGLSRAGVLNPDEDSMFEAEATITPADVEALLVQIRAAIAASEVSR